MAALCCYANHQRRRSCHILHPVTVKAKQPEVVKHTRYKLVSLDSHFLGRLAGHIPCRDDVF